MPRTNVMFDDPTYVVLNIPSPAADIVKDIRRRFDPERADYPVEVSVTGSSGTGWIIPWQNSKEVFAAIDEIASKVKPFTTSFGSINKFDNTGIFYFTMTNVEKFQEIHDMIAASKIKFTPNPYPYQPHCTLNLNGFLTEADSTALMALKPPEIEFTINTISVYELNDIDDGQLLHRCNFGE